MWIRREFLGVATMGDGADTIGDGTDTVSRADGGRIVKQLIQPCGIGKA